MREVQSEQECIPHTYGVFDKAPARVQVGRIRAVLVWLDAQQFVKERGMIASRAIGALNELLAEVEQDGFRI